MNNIQIFQIKLNNYKNKYKFKMKNNNLLKVKYYKVIKI